MDNTSSGGGAFLYWFAGGGVYLYWHWFSGGGAFLYWLAWEIWSAYYILIGIQQQTDYLNVFRLADVFSPVQYVAHVSSNKPVGCPLDGPSYSGGSLQGHARGQGDAEVSRATVCPVF